jgi:hypothetical protein
VFDCFFYEYRSTSVRYIIRNTGVVYFVSWYANVNFVYKMCFTVVHLSFFGHSVLVQVVQIVQTVPDMYSIC